MQLLEGRRTVALSGVAEIIRPVAVKDSTEPQGAIELHEVAMSDFGPDNIAREGAKLRRLNATAASKVEKARLLPGDILIGVKGTIGKVAIVPDSAPNNLLAGQTTVILRLPDNGPIRLPTYLLRYLCLPETTRYLEAHAGGSAIRFIKNRDLAGLPVPIQLLSDQEERDIDDVHQQVVDAIAKARDFEVKAKRLSDAAFSPGLADNEGEAA